MSPTDIETAARREYNAVGDTHWSTAEFLAMMDRAQLELAREAMCIEQVYTTTTVAGTQEYSFPTNTIAIKRVTYDGKVLYPITYQEDDTVTVFNASTASQGIPQWYTVWNDTISLRPIPSDALTLKIYSFNEPQALSVTSTLEVPSLFHGHIVDFLLSRMYSKDKDFNSASYYDRKWMEGKAQAIKWFQRKRVTNRFKMVQDEDTLLVRPVGFL
jgi:hypothetical protein